MARREAEAGVARAGAAGGERGAGVETAGDHSAGGDHGVPLVSSFANLDHAPDEADLAV
jgi:hypothetical protein